MYKPGIQASDVYARLAASLADGSDAHTLLKSLLKPLMQLSKARAGSVSVKCADGRLVQISALELAPIAVGVGRVVLVPLTYRRQELGGFKLYVPDDAVIGADTLDFHRTIGALLGLAVHDSGAEQASRQAVLVDVHDGIAQTLAFVRMRLPVLAQAITSHNESSALRCCDDMRVALGAAHANLRAIMSQNHAPMDPKGLRHALRASISKFQETTRVDLEFDDRAPGLCLSANQESQVFYIVQEALANIAKHARARHAWLQIDQSGDRVDVIVEDDGAGPSAADAVGSPSHFGLEIMRQRAARLGGNVEMAARDGGGTQIRLHFPVTTTEAARA